jgi:hypothetical protein
MTRRFFDSDSEHVLNRMALFNSTQCADRIHIDPIAPHRLHLSLRQPIDLIGQYAAANTDIIRASHPPAVDNRLRPGQTFAVFGMIDKVESVKVQYSSGFDVQKRRTYLLNIRVDNSPNIA